jgi:hypothetical protein
MDNVIAAYEAAEAAYKDYVESKTVVVKSTTALKRKYENVVAACRDLIAEGEGVHVTSAEVLELLTALHAHYIRTCAEYECSQYIYQPQLVEA